MYVVALNGSPDENGNTAYLLNTILEKLKKKGVDGEIISVDKAVSDARWPFCINCSTPCSRACFKDTLLDEAYKKVDKADYVIFGSPVYFGSMTGQLKVFFDKARLVRGEKRWLGKPMTAVSVGASKYGGQERTINAIQSSAMVLGMTVIGNGSELSMGHFGISAERPAKDDKFAANAIDALVERIFCELNR